VLYAHLGGQPPLSAYARAHGQATAIVDATCGHRGMRRASPSSWTTRVGQPS